MIVMISASHRLRDVELRRFAHDGTGHPPKVNTHPLLDRWFVSVLYVDPKDASQYARRTTSLPALP